MNRTKTDEELEAAAEEHADDPERAELLHRARRFKASWIELAEGLTNARKHGQWKKWGYTSFEEYAKTELHLRQETVDKLTGSFLFLQKRAPEVLTRDGVSAPIPSYQAIDFLRRAESQEGASNEAVKAIRQKVIEEGVPLNSVSKQFKETVFPIDEASKKRLDAAAVKNVAKRLRELMDETRAVPRKMASEVAATLDALLEQLAKSDEKAA